MAEETERVVLDPFEDPFQTMLMAQMSRIYDLQLALLTCVDKDFAKYISDLHSSGEFFGTDLAIALPETQVTEE